MNYFPVTFSTHLFHVVLESQGPTGTSINPYLYFNGNARQAIEFYVKVFDAKVEMMKTFGSGPMPVDEEDKEKIMHGSFTIDEKVNIMVSDTVQDKDRFVTGTNVHLSLSMDNVDALNKRFNDLSEGGEVTMPLAKQFWGSTFGSLIDKFGIHWMFSGPYEKPEKPVKKPEEESH